MSYYSLWKICYSYIYIRSRKAKQQNRKESLIEEYRSRIDPNASIDDNNHLSTDSDAKSFVNDKAWHEKQAKENLEWANWHRTQAEKAADRGDHASAKDHISRAKTYDAKAKDYMRSAGMCTKQECQCVISLLIVFPTSRDIFISRH